MPLRYHPEIEGLKVNEDGTEVYYLGEPLEVKIIDRKEREINETPYVVFLGKTHSVGKLVCECWNGMPDNPRWCATRIEKEKGFHYTNLQWRPCGFNPQMGTKNVKRSSLSKLSPEDVEVIEQRLANNEPLNKIAADYGVSDMTIHRVKKKMN